MGQKRPGPIGATATVPLGKKERTDLKWQKEVDSQEVWEDSEE